MSDSLIACRPSSLQWTLPVVHLEDFVSVWDAAERAAELSWRLGFLPEASQSSPSPIPRLEKPAKHVKFSNFDELHLYSDQIDSSYVVPSGLTCHWSGKPWSLNGKDGGLAHEFDDEVSVLMQVNAATASSSGDVVGLPDCAQVELSADVIERLSLIRSTTSTRLIQSHGLFETGIGTRSFTLQEVTPDSFVQQVRDVWPEFSNPLRIYYVWPQPQDLTPGIHFIVEFLPGGELPHHSIVPTLEETVVWSPFGLPDIQRQALYHTQRLQHADVTNPFADLCHRARFVCTVRALGRILPIDAKMNILSGALVQLRAHPPVLHEPPEFVDYFYGMKSFFADSLRLLEETFMPSISWRFHLLLPDGYQGVAETQAPISHTGSASAVADSVFAHWQLELPGALVYAGQPNLGSTVLNFIAFDPEAAGSPCLIQADFDDQLGLPTPPTVAASLSSVCTLQEVVAALGAVWVFDVVGVQITVWDGTLLFDSDDRFKPKPGTIFTVLVQPFEDEATSTLQVMRAMRQSSNLRDPRPSSAPSRSGAVPSSRHPSSVQPSNVVPQEPEPEDGPGDEDDDPEDDPDP